MLSQFRNLYTYVIDFQIIFIFTIYIKRVYFEINQEFFLVNFIYFFVETKMNTDDYDEFEDDDEKDYDYDDESEDDWY